MTDKEMLNGLLNKIEASITPTSKKVFKDYADDAGNWSGQPLVGGNVTSGKKERGNLTQLKIAGLIKTFESDGHMWLTFTENGYHYACSLPVSI
jgi:hypothetical protein